MQLVPLHDKILIKEDKTSDQKVGNVLLPSNAAPKGYSKGTVIACGTGRFQNGINIPISVKTGDRVLYMRYSANCYRDEEKNEVLIRDEDLLGLVKDNDNI